MKNLILLIFISTLFFSCDRKNEYATCYEDLSPSDKELLGHKAHEVVYYKSNYDTTLSATFSYIDYFLSDKSQSKEKGCGSRSCYSMSVYFDQEFYRRATICNDRFAISIESPDKTWNFGKGTKIDYFGTHYTFFAPKDTLRVDNKLFHNVYVFSSHDTITSPVRKFYFSQQNGLLKVVLRNNIIWERVNF